MGKVWAVLGGVLIAGALGLFVVAHRDLRAFQEAPECRGAPGPGCVAVEETTVVGRRVDDHRESGLVGQFGPGAPMGPDPFPPSQFPSSPAGNTSSSNSGPRYYVTVARAGGEPVEVRVNGPVHEAATIGTPARIRVWHGDIVEVEVRGERSTSLPSALWSLGGALLASWFGAGMVARELGGGQHDSFFGRGDLFSWAWFGLWTIFVVGMATAGPVFAALALGFWWFGAGVANTFINGFGRARFTVVTYGLLGPLLLGLGTTLVLARTGTPVAVALFVLWATVPTAAIWFHPGLDDWRRRR
jgi:hypothetical protein